MPDLRPIGAFDSGVGGISVLKEIRRLLPNEDFIYYADSAYCPYGVRPPAEIIARSMKICDFLLEQQCKALVVACNSASIAGLEHYRAHYDVPIIGMEPAVKPATAVTQNGKVGVLATSVTLSGNRFSSLLQRYQNGADVYSQPCPGLVELVESGAYDTPAAFQMVNQYMAPLLEKGIDTLVLGCTHYPFLKDLVKSIAGPGVTVIDTGEAVARQVQRVVSSKGILNSESRTGNEIFHTSGDLQGVSSVIQKLWGGNPPVRYTPL